MNHLASQMVVCAAQNYGYLVVFRGAGDSVEPTLAAHNDLCSDLLFLQCSKDSGLEIGVPSDFHRTESWIKLIYRMCRRLVVGDVNV